MKKKISRILAVLLSILTLLSSFPASALTAGNSYSFEKTYLNAYYETGTWQTADGDYHDNYGQVAQYNLKSTGEPIYCIQIYNGVEGSAATARTIKDTNLWRNELSAIAQMIITRVSIWGYPNYSYGYSKTNAQLATQVLIWEAETGARTNYNTGCSSWAKSIFNNYPDALKCYNEILKACQSHLNVPSFSSTTVTLKGTGESNAVTITDSNGVLSQFERTSTDSNITINSSGNNLKIWATGVTKYSGQVILSKKKTYTDTAFALTGANQTLFYGTISDPVKITINVNVEAEKTCNVTVKKKSSLTGETLDGAAFKVQQYNVSTKTWSDYKTLSAAISNGERVYTATNLLISDDNGGWFKIVETKAPAGYENNPTYSSSDSNTYSDGRFRFIYSEDESGKTFTLTAKDTPTSGNVALKKTADDGKVEGFKFHLYGTADIGVKVDKTGVTKSDGTIDFKGLYVGTYSIEEIEVPDHIIPPAKQTVKVVAGETTPVSFNNSPKKFSVSVEKQSSLTNETLSDAGFKVQQWSKAAKAYVDYVTLTETVVNGKTKYVANELWLSADNEGKFKLVETRVPHGYTNKPVFVSSGDYISATGEFQFDTDSDKTGKTFYFTVKNKPSEGSVSVKKTSEDGKVAGFKFHLYGTSDIGIKVDEYGTSNSKGIIDFKSLYIGTFTIEEIDVPPYYITPEKQTVTVIEDEVTPVAFENDLKRGNLIVIKHSEDNFKEGFRFHLYGTSDSGAKVNEYATTNAQGIAEFNDILIGSNYTIEEINTAIRYVVPDSQTTTIEWKKDSKVEFDNVLKKFRVQVTKIDAQTRTPQGNATLAGAVYGIYQGGELVDTYTTDINGQFITKYYICGNNWTLKEISPSEGYLLDDTVYEIGAEPNLYTVEFNTTSNEVKERVTRGSISIIKHTDDGSTQVETPEIGAEFQIYLKSAGSYAKAKATERDYLVCDENGYARSKLLPYGVYTVHQTKGWDGRELIDDFDVFISMDNKNYPFIINNGDFYSYIKIVKTDAETGKAIPYEGAAFQIYDPDGNLITQTFTYPTPTTIDTFYTNSEGYLVTPEKLPYGKGYKLVEVQAPYGYVLDSTPIVFDIKQEDSTKEDNLTIITIKRPNVPQKGIIEVTKTGEVFASVTKSDDTYTPVFAEQGLPNAVFEIYAYENIYTPDGTLRYKKGQLVDTITTGNDSIARSKELYLGKYTVIEKTAPNTFFNSGLKYNVELTYAGQNVKVTSTALSVYNERQRVSVSLDKVMEQDKNFSIGMNGEILSVKFGLYANEVITAADGTSIPKDGLIATAYCNENGKITFHCDLPIGFKWYVKEIATDEHYILSNTKYAFTTEYKGQDTAAYEIKVNNGKSIINELIYGNVKGLKIDRETKETIAGAVFGLFKPNEIDFTEETAILTAISDKNGVFVFENIPYGDWIIVELKPAANYLHNDDIHHIQINGDGQTLNIQVVNDRIPELSTTATIEGEKEIGATEVFTLIDVVEYKHLIPGKSYVLTGVLMDKNTGKALRINGKTIRSKVEFTPESPSGEIAVEFTFDSKYIKEDTDIVVFETLYRDGAELAAHKDINDKGQTVLLKAPTVGTTATIDGKKEIGATEIFTLTDIVKYDNLVIGKEYVLKGVLMNKNTGEPLVINGENICSEVVFVPESTSGEVTVEFTFDSKFIKEDTDVVVFESLYRNDVEIASHADINDEGQTVLLKVPTIGTTATIDGEKEIGATEVFTLTDIVKYDNLVIGKEYVLKGVLMNKNTGEPLVINGENICSEIVFVPESTSGELTVEFTFDSKYIKEDTEIVVFETLYRNGVEIASHADIDDMGQTVLLKVPTVGTTATIDGEKEIGATEVFTLIDIVKYDNLVIGKEYVLKGILMNKTTGEPLVINDENICSEVVFVPETTSGELTVEFTFDSKYIKEDTDIVVFETLYRSDVEIASHADINDEGQTVSLKVPTIGTTATIEGEKEIGATEVFTLTDIVKYDNLVIGKEYVLKGVLMNKTTGKPLVIDGENIYSEVVFVPETTSGEVAVEFVFDSKYIKEDTNIVVYEVLYRNDVEIASHTDINDEGQTALLKAPKIGTTATIDGEKVIGATEVFTLTDVVKYENLVIGKEYVIKGILMNKTTGKPLVINGENICSEVVFVPESANGEVTVEFTFDSKHIKEDTDIVVFETLYRNDVEIASHADIDDEEQTVSLKAPTIGTSATVDGEKEIAATEVFTLTDIVKYDNLVIGKEYVLKGVLMDKSTRKPLIINGKEVCSEIVFVPESTSGEIAVEFVFDSKNIKTDTAIVVFETLYRDDVEIASHADIKDKDQTVNVKVPTISTSAEINGKKNAVANGEITIKDTVKYSNLTPGKEYTIKGVLMDKSTGKPYMVNGKAVTSEITFIPKTRDGEVSVLFTFDASGIKETTKLVVFETLYRGDDEIAAHEDIKDKAQTVTIKAAPDDTPKTGDNSNRRTIATVMGTSALLLTTLFYFLLKKKKRNDKEEA